MTRLRTLSRRIPYTVFVLAIAFALSSMMSSMNMSDYSQEYRVSQFFNQPQLQPHWQIKNAETNSNGTNDEKNDEIFVIKSFLQNANKTTVMTNLFKYYNETESGGDEDVKEILLSQGDIKYPEIDMVYTWVNGSDPVWRSKKSQFEHKLVQSTHKSLDDYLKSTRNTQNRFHSHDELRYSLRSVAEHAPWIRYIHIVVADEGQIPVWLNTSHPQIRVVFHSEIFERAENLPTFSSGSIESQLDNIPNLSDYFLYANDDMYFGSDVGLSDYFVSPRTGVQRIYEADDPSSPAVRTDCADGCGYEMLGNGRCDPGCDVPACNWDFGDCGGEERLREKKDEFRARLTAGNLTTKTERTGDDHQDRIRFVDGVYNREFRVRRKHRHAVSNMPLLLNRRMMRDMKERFRTEFDLTATHRFRAGRSMQLQFAYIHYITAVHAYAPSAEQAWRAGFDTLLGGNEQIFLYGTIPPEWDHAETDRARNTVGSPAYRTVRDCATRIVAKLPVSGGECARTMRELVRTLRLPVPGGAFPRGDAETAVHLQGASKKNEYGLLYSRKFQKKFVTIHDEMEEHDAGVGEKLGILFDCLFPDACAYELPGRGRGAPERRKPKKKCIIFDPHRKKADPDHRKKKTKTKKVHRKIKTPVG